MIPCVSEPPPPPEGKNSRNYNMSSKNKNIKIVRSQKLIGELLCKVYFMIPSLGVLSIILVGDSSTFNFLLVFIDCTVIRN